MDYEKKYKQSLALMVDCIPDEDGYVRIRPQDIFPELAESEDEKVRKTLIRVLNENVGNGIEKYGAKLEEAITWLENIPYTIDHEKREGFHLGYKAGLEKQGEQKKFRDSIQVGDEVTRNSDGVIVNLSQLKRVAKPAQQKLPIEKLPEEMKTIGESLGFTTQEECDEYNQMVSELIMSDKVEPKFKVGDWIIDDKNRVGIIVRILDEHYIISFDGREVQISFEWEGKLFRKWSIKDAKDGDVLVDDTIEGYSSPFVALYKKIDEECDFESYCFVGFDGKFYKGENGHSTEGIHPATKEQRDILFAKIKEAGYEWDENNKMLKEIVEDEEEPQNYKNQIMSEITDLVKHYIKQKPTCGEAGEDMKEALRTEYEKGRADAFAEIRKKWDDSKKKRQEVISFLESLRLKED